MKGGEKKIMKKICIVMSMLLGFLLAGNKIIAMSCHGGGSNEHQHEEKASEEKSSEKSKKVEIKESFYSTIYTCPMHPEVQSDKSGKCPKCDMKLEKKQMLMTYACPEKDCEYQKAKPGKCPHHDKELIKCEVKYHCPKCDEQVNPEDLKLKPVKH